MVSKFEQALYNAKAKIESPQNTYKPKRPKKLPQKGVEKKSRMEKLYQAIINDGTIKPQKK